MRNEVRAGVIRSFCCRRKQPRARNGEPPLRSKAVAKRARKARRRLVNSLINTAPLDNLDMVELLNVDTLGEDLEGVDPMSLEDEEEADGVEPDGGFRAGVVDRRRLPLLLQDPRPY